MHRDISPWNGGKSRNQCDSKIPHRFHRMKRSNRSENCVGEPLVQSPTHVCSRELLISREANTKGIRHDQANNLFEHSDRCHDRGCSPFGDRIDRVRPRAAQLIAAQTAVKRPRYHVTLQRRQFKCVSHPFLVSRRCCAATDGGCPRRGPVLERERCRDDQDDERHGD
jgi:hypothetical protein